MNSDKILEKFTGIDKGKVQALGIKKSKTNGVWVLRYRDSDGVHTVNCETREILDQILIEFGGKNAETCKTEGRFLELDGKWDSEDLNELGHRITKVQLNGLKVVRQTIIPIPLPQGTGSVGIIQSRRGIKDEIKISFADKEECNFTRSFKHPSEFDELISFIFNHDTLKELKWRVKVLCTESRETNSQCLWQRKAAGDGTKRMVLELRALDGTSFRDCVRQDLFDAAGDMFDAPCKRVRMKKKKEYERDICLFAAEDGSVDISGYEAL